MVLSTFSRKLTQLVSDNAPAILTATGVAGVLTTVYFAVKATPEAYRQIQDAKSETTEEITNLDVVRLVWQEYIPTAVSGVVTIASILAVNTIHTRRQAAVMSLYTISERALSEYQSKVRDTIGERKEKGIRDAVVADRMVADPISNTQVLVTGTGDNLCYDSLTGRYFKSDIETIRRAQNDVNAKAINDMYASQNDFYAMVGLPPAVFVVGHGWRPDAQMDISFSSHLSEEGTPCLALDYRVKPIRGYWKMNG